MQIAKDVIAEPYAISRIELRLVYLLIVDEGPIRANSVLDRVSILLTHDHRVATRDRIVADHYVVCLVSADIYGRHIKRDRGSKDRARVDLNEQAKPIQVWKGKFKLACNPVRPHDFRCVPSAYPLVQEIMAYEF